jgi:hypothetical protein
MQITRFQRRSGMTAVSPSFGRLTGRTPLEGSVWTNCVVFVKPLTDDGFGLDDRLERPPSSIPGTLWTPKAILEVIEFDGDGALSTPKVTVANPFGDTGLIMQPPNGGAPGEYVVNDDCTGTVHFFDANNVTFSILVSGHGYSNLVGTSSSKDSVRIVASAGDLRPMCARAPGACARAPGACNGRNHGQRADLSLCFQQLQGRDRRTRPTR